MKKLIEEYEQVLAGLQEQLKALQEKSKNNNLCTWDRYITNKRISDIECQIEDICYSIGQMKKYLRR